MSETTTRSGGTGFFGLLTILFIGPKLANIINWSWWWVLAPAWIPAAIVIVILFASLALATRHLNRED